METEAITMTEGTFVFHGSFDPDLFEETYADGFEVQTNDRFTIFEGEQGTETDGLAYAVAENSVVAGLQTGEGVEHQDVITTLNDAVENLIAETGRVRDTNDGEFLFESTGDADLVTGFWDVNGLEEEDLQTGDEPPDGSSELEENPVFNTVDSFVSVLTLPASEGGVGGDTVAARFAAVYPEGEVPSEQELREELVPSDTAEETAIARSDTRAHVMIEVSEDELERESVSAPNITGE